jgi:hypothetical protein
MAARFLKLLGLLGAKYMLDEDSGSVIDEKKLQEAELSQEQKYKTSPASIHKMLRDNESEEEKKLRLKIEAMGKR